MRLAIRLGFWPTICNISSLASNVSADIALSLWPDLPSLKLKSAKLAFAMVPGQDPTSRTGTSQRLFHMCSQAVTASEPIGRASSSVSSEGLEITAKILRRGPTVILETGWRIPHSMWSQGA